MRKFWHGYANANTPRTQHEDRNRTDRAVPAMSAYDDPESPEYREHNLGDPRETPEEKRIGKLERENEYLRAALRDAIATIKVWHNMGLDEAAADSLGMWQVYYDNAPELRRLRKALGDMTL